MTHTQLEYILAVDTYRNFSRAAKHCMVTQPTLSMQIQKLEEELGVLLFDRNRKPLTPTTIGIQILKQAKIAIREFNVIPELIKLSNNELRGTFKLGVIPTIAPYLIPLFIFKFMQKYPTLKLHVSEMNTNQIIDELAQQSIDCGIMATPSERTSLSEEPLYYEPLLVYLSPNHPLFKQRTVKVEDLNISELLMLTEENCLHSQIKNLCKNSDVDEHQFQYLSGSLETIKQMVQLSNGITLLPELATRKFDVEQMDMLRYFRGIEPVREISVVTQKGYRKHAMIDALKDEIQAIVPAKMLKKNKSMVVKLIE